MSVWTKGLERWLGSAAILTSLLMAAPVAAQNQNEQGENERGCRRWVEAPEPATMTLIALGSGTAALLGHRRFRGK
jgi:PEP-CTERM motif-containing protein